MVARYKFELNWNRNFAASGEATAPAAYEIISRFVIDNGCTMGKFDCGIHGAYPKLQSILELEPIGGHHPDDIAMNGYCSNGTGRASWSIYRIS